MSSAVHEPDLSHLEAVEMQRMALQHCEWAENLLKMSNQPALIAGYTGALILARAAWWSTMKLHEKGVKGTINPYRELAHLWLDSVWDEVELMMTKTEGRA